MSIIDGLIGELGGLAEKYARAQLRDLRDFVLLAVAADPARLTADGLRDVLNVGIKWVAKHGKPTAAKVREALGGGPTAK